ncbi:heptosyltransferase-2 [Desulfurobacterium pacificum]|uniref:lipopolysaccharide heptosyltransferase II n=1 Tax=Desulfurobacterium pacificum TaxID=240166 RepID=A0ABY1ND11_9BACT|nr:lipopolysaccharide heptosyltransferase II [Desulfurobacterium pacificum]SMP06726.1 heptosyltransferase-2 [Desulfurobacterium pacificum]
MAFKKILIFQTAFLGDLILTSPLIKSVKKSFPETEVSLVVRKGFKSVFAQSPYLSEIIEFDKKGIFRFSSFLKSKNFDLVISPHRSHRTSLILFLSGIRRRIGFDKSGFAFLYTDRVKHKMEKRVHEIDRNLNLLTPLKNYSLIVDNEPELPISDEEAEKTAKKFKLEKPFIVLAPGSVWKTKAWLSENFAKVGDYFYKQGFQVVIVGSNKDAPYCQVTEENMKGKAKNLCGKTTLREFFSIIKRASLVISNDSSPVHAAVSFNTPVVEIYGATVPDFGFFPYRNGIYVEPPIELPCRPCGIHGRKECPEKHFKCMKSITPEMVITTAESLI